MKKGLKMIVYSESELSEINVTPFIDVMLVLLIIFMVVTPLVTSSLKVELPKAASKSQVDEKTPTIIAINELGEIKVGKSSANLDNLTFVLNGITKNNKDEVVYFYVDKAVSYEKLIVVINKIKESGYGKIALSTEVKE